MYQKTCLTKMPASIRFSAFRGCANCGGCRIKGKIYLTAGKGSFGITKGNKWSAGPMGRRLPIRWLRAAASMVAAAHNEKVLSHFPAVCPGHLAICHALHSLLFGAGLTADFSSRPTPGLFSPRQAKTRWRALIKTFSTILIREKTSKFLANVVCALFSRETHFRPGQKLLAISPPSLIKIKQRRTKSVLCALTCCTFPSTVVPSSIQRRGASFFYQAKYTPKES
jgi:hypothetical protein